MVWCKSKTQKTLAGLSLYVPYVLETYNGLTWFISLCSSYSWEKSFPHRCVSSHIAVIVGVWTEFSDCSSQCCPIHYWSENGHVWSNHLFRICLTGRSVTVHSVCSDDAILWYGWRPQSRQLVKWARNSGHTKVYRWWWSWNSMFENKVWLNCFLHTIHWYM